MKRLMLLFAGIFIYTSAFSQTSMDTLYVESVSFNTETIISVPCPNFEESFQSRIKLNIVTSKDTLSILESFLRKVKYAKKTDDIDVRAKFIYEKSNGARSKICMSKFDILIDGRLIKSNKKFYDFLRGLTK